jgi:hypothetical protein
MMLCFLGVALSLTYDSGPGVTLSIVALVVILIADAYFLEQRAKRPDFNAWDEI